jgi:hypothetical protein
LFSAFIFLPSNPKGIITILIKNPLPLENGIVGDPTTSYDT